MPEIIKSQRRSAIFLAVYYSVVSASILLFASPLFRVLSFEYSSLVALFGSLPVMLVSATYAQANRDEKMRRIFPAIWKTLLPAIVLPVIISLIFVESCDILSGLRYYTHIVIPSTITGSVFGVCCGLLAKSVKGRVGLVIGIWLGTFILSLAPGYFSSQIFTFGWQYGYFPGFVWDDYIQLGMRYNVAIFGYMLFAVFILYFVLTHAQRKEIKSKKEKLPVFYYIVDVVFSLFILESAIDDDLFFGNFTHKYLRRELSETVTIGHTTIYTKDRPEEAQTILKHDVGQYLTQIDSLYPGIDTTMELEVYVYPSSEDLYKFVGTRRASIAKPWLGTLHIAEENLESLKHELVHLLLKPHGNFPTYASWSTGLTEGAAVAAEDDFDGLRTVDELSALAIRMKFVSDVTPLMQFTGFAATASSASYMLTGSFAKYLIATYGSKAFLEVYHTQDFDDAYGKPLSQLNDEWKAKIAFQHLISEQDVIIAKYYFERTSVVNQPCLRYIGRLAHEAREAYRGAKYEEAFDLYHQVYAQDSSRIDALRGMLLSKIKQRKFSEAAALLREDSIMMKPNGKVLLSSLAADIGFFETGNIAAMKDLYTDAVAYAPNAERFISATGFLAILEDSTFNISSFLAFRYGIDSARGSIPQALYERPWESQMPESVRLGYILLRTQSNEGSGEYSAAVHEWDALQTMIDPAALTPAMRRAYDITDRKVQRWKKALDLY